MAEKQDDGWPVSVEIPVLWGDMDAFGHVNNTVFFRWFESARIALFEKTGLMERMEALGIGPILARATCDFRLQVAYPDTVRTAARATRIGRTSFDIAYRTTRSDGALVAEGESVIVMLDYRQGGKTPIDEALRTALTALGPTPT